MDNHRDDRPITDEIMQELQNLWRAASRDGVPVYDRDFPRMLAAARFLAQPKASARL